MMAKYRTGIIASSGDDPDVPVDWNHIDVEAMWKRRERLYARAGAVMPQWESAQMARALYDAGYRDVPRDDPPREVLPAPSVVSPRFGELITALNSGTLDHATADRYITMLGDFDLDGDGQKVKDHARA